MEKQHLTGTIIPLIFAGLLFAFYDPFMILMPEGVVMFALGGLVVLYVLFALFMWHEVVRDEREASHRFFASRVSFLVGSGVLTAGVAYQVFYIHHVDPWLLFALGAMVAAKAGASLYADFKR